MKKYRDKTNIHQRGFTLIEIMIVVFTIGLIVAIAVPAYLKARSRSQALACQESQDKMEAAISRWAIDTGQTKDAVPTYGDLVGYELYVKTTPACPIKTEPDGGGEKRPTPIEPTSVEEEVVCPIVPKIKSHERTENAT